MRERVVTYLNKNDPRDQKKLEALESLVAQVINKSEEFIHGLNTCAVEGFHSQREKFTNKRISSAGTLFFKIT